MLKPLIIIKILLTASITLFNSINQAEAQVRLQDPEESTKSFSERLWYGGNINLGFQGTNNYNVFFFGISPMAGYKITEDFSVGPRMELFYTYYKAFVWREGAYFTTHPISYSGGIFSRYKFLNNFFGHLEYGIEKTTFLLTSGGDFVVIDNKLATTSKYFDNFYIGIGYTSGGRFGSEISILYNVIQNSQTLDIPISIRIGFNYNF
ncbi:MAG: hypothetical protein EA362_04595 [Saprospirales bacterium]|nr:MAG: hypothetical protein EA362_04595 [Saprospirales bacterium]